MAVTATCETDNGHVHVYTIPVSDGYHLELEDRIEPDRAADAGVTVWRVREPVEPWLPAANYTLLARYESVEDAFADHADGQAVPAVECTAVDA